MFCEQFDHIDFHRRDLLKAHIQKMFYNSFINIKEINSDLKVDWINRT